MDKVIKDQLDSVLEITNIRNQFRLISDFINSTSYYELKFYDKCRVKLQLRMLKFLTRLYYHKELHI